MKEFIRKLLKETLLSEKTLSDVTVRDFNLKGIAHNWLMSTPSIVIHNFKYEMQDDYNMSEDEKEELLNADEDDIIESKRFKKWLMYEVEYKVEDAINEIGYLINDGKITVWRVMTVDDNWLKKLATTGSRLGKYWSFDENSAEAHWGGTQNNTIKLQVTVNDEYIDWYETIEANVNPGTGEDEKEITLFKNTPLRIDGILLNGEVMNIDTFKDKIFKA